MTLPLQAAGAERRQGPQGAGAPGRLPPRPPGRRQPRPAHLQGWPLGSVALSSPAAPRRCAAAQRPRRQEDGGAVRGRSTASTGPLDTTSVLHRPLHLHLTCKADRSSTGRSAEVSGVTLPQLPVRPSPPQSASAGALSVPVFLTNHNLCCRGCCRSWARRRS